MSQGDLATFRFAGAGMEIKAEVTRAEFERWIADDLAGITATVDQALVNAGVGEGDIDRVFLTGGTSLVPAVRGIFDERFGTARIMDGGELTSIAHGLALIAQADDLSPWTT